eukprot:543509_1
MGNQSSTSDALNQLKRGKKRGRYHEFIMEFARDKSCPYPSQNPCILSNERRAVFVSLVGLLHTYHLCSPHLLYHALLVLPMKRDCLYNLSKYIDLLHACSPSISSAELVRFWRLLMWKDSQNLVFYMLDKYEQKEPSFIHPFWMHFSKRLSELYNPMTTSNYNALVDETERWWQTYHHTDAEDVSDTSVLNELFNLTMKFKPMQEIICKSNPIGLQVVTFYSANGCGFTRNEGGWFIANDYEQSL